MFHKPKKLLTIALLVLITLMLCSAIVVFSSNAYVVYEGEAVTTFSSKEDITLNALTANGFVISEDKYVEMPENASFGITKVYIYNKNKVTLKDGIETRTLYSYNNQTVEDFLTENEITLGEFDSVSIPLTDEITGDLEFSITRVSHTTREETVSIPFQTEQRPSDALYKNTTKVVQKGANGSKKQVFEVITTNGVETSKKLLSETVTKEPVKKIVEYGTKTKSGFITTKSGEKLEYKNVLSMTATAYTTERTSDKITATGQVARVGIVAVDRRVIPLGTKLYITSADGKKWIYGTAVAGDTGVRGNTIDLFFNTYNECISFGRQKALVYILK